MSIRFASSRGLAAALPAALFALCLPAGASAAETAAPPCKPCVGLAVADPYALVPQLGLAPALEKDARLYVAWDVALDGTGNPAAAQAIAAAGAVPWMRLAFTTPAPVLQHLPELQRELEVAAAIARDSPPASHFEVVWTGAGEGVLPAKDYGFLFKRAAVAVNGASAAARVLPQPLPADPAWLGELYGEEVAAYLDGVVFAPAADDVLAAAIARAAELDPGRPVIVDAAAWPGDSRLAIAEAARFASLGVALTLVQAPNELGGPAPAAALGEESVEPAVPPAAPAPGVAVSLAPFKVVANEFRGDLSLDPYSRPEGADAAWSFVRGEDLALRVLATPPAGASEMSLRFADTQLKAPAAVNLYTGEVVALGGNRPTGEPMRLALRKTGPLVLLRIERVAAAEIDGGVAEKVEIAGERQIPVEEILRRLQAFEDGQARRLDHYQAVNATMLRFQLASGVQTFEATFEGAYFARRGEAPDWTWESFYINGVRWRGKEIPELPLIQPEKAASMPLEILFTKEYRYSLRGTEVVNGRDCWVVDFEPAAPVEGRSLYRGTVWVDREISSRVRSRAVQLGLEGEVLSNEETIEYTPVDAAGKSVEWGAGGFVLPLTVYAQQILSIVNTATVVEKETRLTSVVINGDAFDAERDTALASDATMVRDTDKGLRYLVKDEATGERVVQEGYDTSQLFALGGAFYDDSLDYPLPLIGINYFDLNFRGGDRQLNFFFGGVLGILNYADPRLGETRIDAGADAFALAIATEDQLYRDGVASPAEDVEERPARVTLNLGYPLGSHGKVTGTYQLAYQHYGRADDTDPDFVLPESTLTHRLGLELAFARSGYRLALNGAYHLRADWSFWGLPGNTEFDPDQDSYATWEASIAKNWYLPKFQKVGLEVNYLGGENLDRFSKYQFGFFGGNRVHGYQIGKVRAEETWGGHLTYGFEIGKLFRLDAVVDGAWATDEVSGLENELLSGAGLVGTLIGPWDTLINIDVGTPLSGPDDGIVAYIVFLKLFG